MKTRWTNVTVVSTTAEVASDLLISRIIETRGTKPNQAEPGVDAEWNNL